MPTQWTEAQKSSKMAGQTTMTSETKALAIPLKI